MNPTVPVAYKLLDRIPQAHNIQKARLWRAAYFDPLVENIPRSALARSIPPFHITKIYFVEGAVVTSNIGSRQSDRRKIKKLVAEYVEEKTMGSFIFITLPYLGRALIVGEWVAYIHGVKLPAAKCNHRVTVERFKELPTVLPSSETGGIEVSFTRATGVSHRLNDEKSRKGHDQGDRQEEEEEQPIHGRTEKIEKMGKKKDQRSDRNLPSLTLNISNKFDPTREYVIKSKYAQIRLYSSPQSPITLSKSLPCFDTSVMLFMSSSSNSSENMAFVSLICSDRPSLTPTMDPATDGCSPKSSEHMRKQHRSITNPTKSDI
ncbi:hypothetical protein MUK42_13591 [Musa troglodytarum]|uniref:Uncharacterized protein n=2 Tax=Musa troglodytarum TaxID=320322 RepID=A0A9E7HYN5_9LILI|nr:hypothetical protein MUK42_13591 [Musa troglodytarum]